MQSVHRPAFEGTLVILSVTRQDIRDIKKPVHGDVLKWQNLMTSCVNFAIQASASRTLQLKALDREDRKERAHRSQSSHFSFAPSPGPYIPALFNVCACAPTRHTTRR